MEEHNGGVSTSSAMRAAHRGMPPPTLPTRPKIKIIHIIAPEIIKTDVAHFRDLVQRLTGKPAACASSSTADDVASTPPPVGEEEMGTTTKKRLRPAPAPAPVADDERSDDSKKVQEEPTKKRKIKCEVKVEEGGLGDYDLDRSDLWMDLNPGGFLSFLEEEGVFQGLAADHDFLQPFGSSRMDLALVVARARGLYTEPENQQQFGDRQPGLPWDMGFAALNVDRQQYTNYRS